MKVTLYIDGEHNTVEVKDKIKSVLPDANYMIFHPAENKGKVTEFDRIKKMSLYEFAKEILVVKMINLLPVPFYCALPLNKFYDDEKEAIKAVVKWLETEVEE